MNRVWILALNVALSTACRGGTPMRSTTPDTRTPSPATSARPSESIAIALDDDTPPADAPSSSPREDTSFVGVSQYYLREGAFPTREQTFRPGLTLEGAFEGAVEGDGSHAQLVALTIPHDGQGDAVDLPTRVLAYLRRTASGWRSELLPDSFYDTYWRPPIVVIGRPVLVAEQHNNSASEWIDYDDGRRELSPGGTTYYYSLASRDDDGRWFLFDLDLHTTEYYEHYEFAGRPDGSLLVTSVDGRGRRRWRVLQVDWTERRIIGPDDGRSDGAWSRGAPPASVPRPRVTQMEGVVCHAVIDAPFRARRTETAAPTGTLYPAHTYLTLLSVPGVVRGNARLFRVRVANAHDESGPEGFAFVRDREIWDSCPLPERGSGARLRACPPEAHRASPARPTSTAAP